MNCRSRVGRLTAFYKDLSNIYLKDVNDQGFNQPYHDTRSWYHRMAVSVECLQAPLLRSGSPGTCLQATTYSQESSFPVHEPMESSCFF